MSRVVRLLAGLVLVLLAVRLDALPFDKRPAQRPVGEDRPAARKFVVDKARDILSSPDLVESYRVDGDFKAQSQRGSKAEERLADYPILGRGPALSKAWVRRLFRLVSSPKQYGYLKQCLFEPGVGLRYRKGMDELILLICFHCDDWEFQYRGNTTGEPFDAIRADLVRLAKELFPKDPAIRALKPRR